MTEVSRMADDVIIGDFVTLLNLHGIYRVNDVYFNGDTQVMDITEGHFTLNLVSVSDIENIIDPALDWDSAMELFKKV